MLQTCQRPQAASSSNVRKVVQKRRPRGTPCVARELSPRSSIKPERKIVRKLIAHVPSKRTNTSATCWLAPPSARILARRGVPPQAPRLPTTTSRVPKTLIQEQGVCPVCTTAAGLTFLAWQRGQISQRARSAPVVVKVCRQNAQVSSGSTNRSPMRRNSLGAQEHR